MQELTPIQARVVGCLMEKKETTPDQYPLTINALRNACNQRSSRNPVTHYTEGEVGHAIRELEGMGLVREHVGARVPKYEHRVGAEFQLHSKGIAVLTTLVLRGPQTLGELRNHSQRMFAFDDLDDVLHVLRKLADRDPPLVRSLPPQPGQKDDRYAHLLCGEPEMEATTYRISATPGDEAPAGNVQTRLTRLEAEVVNLKGRLRALEKQSGA